MSHEAIHFKEPCAWDNLGRNRYSKAHGVNVYQIASPTVNGTGEILLEPIKGNGAITQGCRIVIELASVPSLIAALQRLYDQKE